MRAIASPFFEASPALLFPVIGLCLFVALFTVVFIRVLRTQKSSFDRLAALPLEGSEPVREHRAEEPS